MRVTSVLAKLPVRKPICATGSSVSKAIKGIATCNIRLALAILSWFLQYSLSGFPPIVPTRSSRERHFSVGEGAGLGEADVGDGDGVLDGVGDGVADGVALADADAATCAFLLASCERCAIPITAATIAPTIRANTTRNAVTLPASRSRFLRVTFRSARRSRCSVSFSQAACFSAYPRT